MNKSNARQRDYKVGDEVSYALASGIRYGTVTRVIGDMIEVQFEDGQKDMKKVRDGRLRLLRRQTEQETRRQHYSDIEEVRRSDIRRR